MCQHLCKITEPNCCSVHDSWELLSQEAAKLRSMPPDASLKPCLRGMLLSNLTLAMPLTVCTGMPCWMQLPLCALKYTGFVISLTIATSVLKFWNLLNSLSRGASAGWPTGPPSVLSRHPSHALCIDQRFGGWIPRRLITLGGPESTLATDVEAVRLQGEALGLSLNVSKCEYISATRFIPAIRSLTSLYTFKLTVQPFSALP